MLYVRRETFLMLLREWVIFRQQLCGNKQSQRYSQYGFQSVYVCNFLITFPMIVAGCRLDKMYECKIVTWM